MKAYVEGIRSLLYYVAYCEDLTFLSDSEQDKEKYQNLVELLIPIAKGYVTDRAFDMCSFGMQIFGGYGYTKDYPQEQLLRDCKITQIYEGTNGIQAMDLLGRKLGMKKGQLVMDIMEEISKIVKQAKDTEGLEEHAARVEEALNKMDEVAMHIGKTAMAEKIMEAFLYAYPLMELLGDVMLSWMLLWRSVIAKQALPKAKKKDIAFYEGQVKTMEFFVYTVLTTTLGKMNAILTTNASAVEIDEASSNG